MCHVKMHKNGIRLAQISANFRLAILLLLLLLHHLLLHLCNICIYIYFPLLQLQSSSCKHDLAASVGAAATAAVACLHSVGVAVGADLVCWTGNARSKLHSLLSQIPWPLARSSRSGKSSQSICYIQFNLSLARFFLPLLLSLSHCFSFAIYGGSRYESGHIGFCIWFTHRS